MNLNSLVHRELGEGMTEKELASAVGVPARTISNILAGKLPHDPAIWERFARYFRIDADFLRTGGPPYAGGIFDLTKTNHLPAGRMRRVPLLTWNQMDQMVSSKEPPCVIHAEAMLETDVPGKRTFALQVKDDSMQPLFSESEVIFVDPDLPTEPGHYVVIEGEGGRPDGALLRQLKEIGGRTLLHALNRRYKDLPLPPRQRVWGRVVRLRKTL